MMESQEGRPQASVSGEKAAPNWHLVMALTAIAMCICYIDRVNISVAAIAMQTEFGWSPATKGLVLSSFFAGYLIMQLIGGILANRFGGWLVLGVSVLMWSIFTLITPVAAYISIPLLVITRILMGLGEGSAFPAGYNIIAHWVPPDNQTRAVGLMMSGAAIGTVIALVSGGWIVDRFGWPWIFYSFGATGIIWLFFWVTLVPRGQTQRTTDQSEKTAPKPSVPWRRMITQKPIWAIAFAAWTYGWTFYIFLGWLPSYYNDVFNLSLSTSGLYSALPWLVLFFMHNISSWIATHLMGKGLSRTRTRKLMQCTANFATALLVVVLTQVESSTLALIIITLAFAALSFATPGWVANVLDVAPRHSDVLAGVMTAISSSAGLVSVGITGLLIEWTGSYQAVFWATAVVCTLSAILWLFWCVGIDVTSEENHGER